MSNTPFVAKIIAILAVIPLTLSGPAIVYGVFLQIKVALTAASIGCSSAVAIAQFADDVTYYKWVHGRVSLAALRYLADTRLTAIRNEFLTEN